MFFSIAPQQDKRFFQHELIGSNWFSHDAGWTLVNNSWSKGYYHNSIAHGNFLCFNLDNNSISVTHDELRACPLWWNSKTHTLTNLQGQGQQIWADDSVTINDLGLQSVKVDLFGDVNTDILSIDTVVDFIVENLLKKVQALKIEFDHVPKKLFVSGGVDTVLLYALCRHIDLDVELLNYEHFEYDRFTDYNIEDIKNHYWAYNQIHHWQEPSVLITGACGDEFLFRGPYTIAQWAAWHNIDIRQHLDQGYHVEYFQKQHNLTIFQDWYSQQHNLKSLSYKQLVQQILNCNANDYQHWHIGNTITWTPFKDLELTKIMLRLSPQDLLSQIIDATVTKQVIGRMYEPALKLVSNAKNLNSRRELWQLYN